MSQHKPPYFGAAYYPEDWPASQVDEDIRLMKKAGMNCMRIGEFAWSSMEPQEGQYDLDWLHRVVDKLGKAGIASIMCTPSCTPPAWLVSRYPEVLIVDSHGEHRQHGARRNACPNSPVYRDQCARIVTRMAEEFGRDGNVIGWQLDNEVYPPIERGCCCLVCMQKFQDAMRARYGTVRAMNSAWCNSLWSQDYSSFAQIPPPRPNTWHHPSLLLLWSEFVSDSYVDFCRAQAEILHRLTRQPVGTDMMPVFGVAFEPMHRHLDLVQYNHYHQMDNLWESAFWFDYIRTIKPAPFWNTETATCWNGSTAANGYKDPGFCRANSWLPFALGGEANLYWLWREHWAGQELMHSGVVSSSGRPLHVFDEVREIASGLQAAGPFLRETKPVGSGLAVHVSSRASFLFDCQSMTNGFNYQERLMTVYRQIVESQLRPDLVDPAADLKPYKVVVSPFLPWIGESGLQSRVKRWIEAGGTWIVGPMSDVRNGDGAKHTHAPYGVLEKWTGSRCKYQIPAQPRQFNIRWEDGAQQNGSCWYDGLEPRACNVLARYVEGPLEGLAAVVEKKIGRGRVILLGTMPEQPGVAALIKTVCSTAGIEPVAEASPNLVVAPRSGKGGRGWVVVEVHNTTGQVVLPKPARDLLTGRQLEGEVTLAPYGVLVLKW